MLKNLFGHILDIIEELFKQEEIWVFLFLVFLGGALVIILPVRYIIWLLTPFVVFAVLWPLTRSTWLFWRQAMFKKNIDFVLLELKIPRQIKKTPEAMEQVLAAMASLRNAPGDIREKYIDGEVTRWFSLEIVSFGGEIHFYVMVYKKLVNLLESAFFSYYPDIEVVEVEDYVKQMPQDLVELYRRDWDIWATEMILTREDAYPIKTYPHFEAELEERQNDPMSTFLEVLSKVKPGEFVGIQILIAPAGSEWRKKWEGLLENMKEPKMKEITSGADQMQSFAKMIARSPVETDVLEEVEKNLSKPAFDTLIRFIYTAPNNIFYESFARRGLVGAFNQYSTLHMNGFRQNIKMSTRTLIWYWPHLFPKWRNEYKKQRILYNYLNREVPPETWMGRLITSHPLNWNFISKRFQMNIEGLATIFHPPSSIVLTEPHIRHLESRRMGPPAGLPIFGEEDDVEKYK
ncbi:MAG TPA: hypothetical protein VNK70_01560 [Candidatus Paceibacterota bacterium]|nr:hypothetical protein [Candidatus Paceibacterota bacterium]